MTGIFFMLYYQQVRRSCQYPKTPQEGNNTMKKFMLTATVAILSVATSVTAFADCGTCLVQPLTPRPVKPVITTCAEALASISLRTQSDGGMIAIVSARDGGFCVKTPKGIYAYIHGGEQITDRTTGQICTKWQTADGANGRLFWNDSGMIKSRKLW